MSSSPPLESLYKTLMAIIISHLLVIVFRWDERLFITPTQMGYTWGEFTVK